MIVEVETVSTKLLTFQTDFLSVELKEKTLFNPGDCLVQAMGYIAIVFLCFTH